MGPGTTELFHYLINVSTVKRNEVLPYNKKRGSLCIVSSIIQYRSKSSFPDCCVPGASVTNAKSLLAKSF